ILTMVRNLPNLDGRIHGPFYCYAARPSAARLPAVTHSRGDRRAPPSARRSTSAPRSRPRRFCWRCLTSAANAANARRQRRPDRAGGGGNPAIRPHLVPLTNGNAMTKTDDLDKLRPALLQLHKALLDAQRIRYERENGRVESRGELLALVLEDASFEWLRVLSALIARLDELADADNVDDKN